MEKEELPISSKQPRGFQKGPISRMPLMAPVVPKTVPVQKWTRPTDLCREGLLSGSPPVTGSCIIGECGNGGARGS